MKTQGGGDAARLYVIHGWGGVLANSAMVARRCLPSAASLPPPDTHCGHDAAAKRRSNAHPMMMILRACLSMHHACRSTSELPREQIRPFALPFKKSLSEPSLNRQQTRSECLPLLEPLASFLQACGLASVEPAAPANSDYFARQRQQREQVMVG